MMMSGNKKTGPSHPDAVFFGSDTTATIESITKESVVYRDSEGVSQEIVLSACSRGRFVADRYLSRPPWTVRFYDSAATRMEFESYLMVYEKLINPLGQNGWHTFDCT